MNTSFFIVGGFGAGHLTKSYSIQYEQESIIMTESGTDYKNIYYFVFNDIDAYIKYHFSDTKQKYFKNPFYIENITTSDIEFIKFLINIIVGYNYDCSVNFSQLFEKISDCIKYYVKNSKNKISNLEKENNKL
jgi:hypothetical protein